MAVYDGSPARAAGLRAGDIVLGPPGGTSRSATRFASGRCSPPSTDAAAARRRCATAARRVTLTPKPFPQKWPVPARPAEGGERRAAAPARLRIAATPPQSLASGTPHLLFFWATWCAICKSALPEIAAFERERHTPVVAITDEDRSRLDPFFADHSGPFPALVATDENRQAFLAYGVSGMPTFVLVDGKGVVRGYATGYSPAKGLGSRRLAMGRPACAVTGVIRQPPRFR